MNRRNFLKGLAPLGLAPMILNGIPVRSMANSLASQLTCAEVNERILVLIQLHGGNDGLNTLIPLDQYSTYRNYRPTVGIRDTGAGAYLGLNATNAVHPEMGGIKSLFDDGYVNFIQDVGYDNVDRSHFKGNDLWLTGGDSTASGQTLRSGWIGRYLNDRFPNFPAAYPNPTMPDPLALEFGSRALSLGFNREQGAPTGLAVGDSPTDFYNLISTVGGTLPSPSSVPSGSQYGEQLQYIMDTQRSGNEYAQRLNDSFNLGSNAASVTYPDTYHSPAAYHYNNPLTPQLKTIARLIDGGLRTRVYMVRMEGFDTHSNQVSIGDPAKGTHAVLLYHLSSALKAFIDDLRASGNADKVVAATFSEFGRQIGENGSKGTDHGTMAPMMVVGTALNGGITGNNPNLSSVSNNIINTKQYDYRQVYTTLLQDWLGTSDTSLTNTMFSPWINQKVPLISANQIAPPSCYASTFPVGLTYFDAIVENNSVVRLNWQTATETNNDFFDVQRSIDGVVFERLERVTGAGNSTSTRTYTTLDHKPHKGISYYRLKQVDFDGRSTISEIVSVMIGDDFGTEVKIQSYPNPADDKVFLQLNASESVEAEITFMNVTGQTVLKQPVSLHAGQNKHEIDVSDLIPGLYHLDLSTGRKGSYLAKQLGSIKQLIRR